VTDETLVVNREGLALLVVDVQHRAVTLGPYCGETVINNITALISACRTNNVEVIHVQHDGGPGSECEAGSEAWEIHGSVRPEAHEKVIHKKYNSAFRDTDLREHLERQGVTTLIVVGIQTEYCVDTTIRVGFEYGFAIIAPEMTNTTYDNGELTGGQIYELHNRQIFDGRFATVCSMQAVLQAIRNGDGFVDRPAKA
jgi:nicotinamidase-related amidase